ncbi:MAG: glycosyltransferase, partial [Thermoprotei archaeon]
MNLFPSAISRREAVVVDNFSSNADIISRLLTHHHARLIRLEGNYGVYHAVNAGIQYVEDADWVLFLDWDSEVMCDIHEVIRA